MKILNNALDIEALLISFKNALPSIRDGKVNIKDFAKKLYNFSNVCAWEEDKIIKGFAAFYANDMSCRIAYLTMIAVKGEYRREGIGSKILDFVERQSKEKGMNLLKLEVSKANIVAISFYKKYGYIVCEETPTSYYMVKKINEENNSVN